VAGGTNRSYGIQVARLAGIPDPVIKRSKKILFDIEQGESGTAESACLGIVKDASGRGPVQLDLFRKPDNQVAEKLKQMDISVMTPLEALNVLNELQELSKKKT